MPLFLRGLELPDAEIRASVIDTFLAAAEGNPSEQNLVSEHASTLVSTMLRNCVVEQMPSMVSRSLFSMWNSCRCKVPASENCCTPVLGYPSQHCAIRRIAPA
jgi:hypothetical protein